MRNIIFSVLLFACHYNAEAQTSVLRLADSLLTVGNYEAALTELHRQDDSPLIINNKIAEIYQRVGNYSKAIEFHEKAYAQQPSDLTKEQIGRCYQALGYQTKAIGLFEEVLAAHPENLLLSFNLAKLYEAERKTDQAIELYKWLEIADSTNANYSYQMGLAYMGRNSKDVLQSITQFLKAFNKDSLHLKSIYQLAKGYEQLQFKDSTMLFIDKGLALSPESLNFNQLKVKETFKIKAYDTTLVYLAKLDTLGFSTKFTYMMYGLTYNQLEKYAEAEIAFKAAQRLDFRDADIAYNLGLTYMGLEDFQKAVRSFNLAMMLKKPDLDEFYYRLGLSYVGLNQVPKAISVFKDGMKDSPGNHELMFELALLSEQYYKDKNIALDLYESFLNRFSNRDEQMKAYAIQQIKAIKKDQFMDTEKAK